MDELAHWLKTLTGMPAVALSPKAGAHGELCGLLAIRAAHEAKGDGAQDRCWSPPPPTAPTRPPPPWPAIRWRRSPRPPTAGWISPTWPAKLDADVAAVMVTNPNTCGLFERDVIEIARLTHAAGAYFYCDGANFNAIVGRVRPGDLGVDAMHINLHKTFSTPHGGGGPGRGAGGAERGPGARSPRPPGSSHGEHGFGLIEHARRRGRPGAWAACAPSTARWACMCAP